MHAILPIRPVGNRLFMLPLLLLFLGPAGSAWFGTTPRL